MPVGLDPNETYPYVFSTDRAKPGPVPTLLFYFPTCSEVRRIGNAFDASDDAESIDASIQLRADAIRVILAGWRNFTDRAGNAVPFDPAALESVLTDTDFDELRARLIRDMSLSELEKKRSAFSALSSTASSVAAAPAVNAPAVPALKSQPNSPA